MWKVFLILAVLAGYGAILTGCNTVHGFGEDTEHAGQHIEHAADDSH